MHISKIRFLFPVSFTIEYKVGIAELYLYTGFGAFVGKCGHQSPKAAKIGIPTPLKLANYFQFLLQIIGDEATTFLSCTQNFVKLGEELWT